jgi:hypothetical protein
MTAPRVLAIYVHPNQVVRWINNKQPNFNNYYEVYLIPALVDCFEEAYGMKFLAGFPLKESAHNKFSNRLQSVNQEKLTEIINEYQEEDTSIDLLFALQYQFGERGMSAIACQLKRYGKNPNDERTDEALVEKILEWQEKYKHDEMDMSLVVLVEGYEPDFEKLEKILPSAFQGIVVLNREFTHRVYKLNPKYLESIGVSF